MRAAASIARSGRLVYVIGPSGSGKDSIIAYARARLADDPDAPVFVRRHITRPAESGGEDHIPISPSDFEQACIAGRFALAWRGNGHGYGVETEIDLSLGAGRHAVLNGSRAYLPEAAARYPGLMPVLIRIDPAVLRERLAGRGRESAAEIEARVRRAMAFEQVAHRDLVEIANDGPLVEAGEAFLALLRSL
ncbi:phosphonate metabolism protein/1,5-bisphosphokinase (PRPP-forming) PhnN [Dongia sedimenti]|uniref:Ribose 1,5-bisphosphate phosphokinase PhnN n=1 Tax=Dongia sedimenti TaxID=3064282 RepID=A0ABU0YTR1_9PROT|nr:phosphonate metabolism protein/1,5-bisphosphokinase (PRPP-forming) PhnN [Rhodospirillaceae bacterium R-7]